MKDREMLELAAKAYGINVYESVDGTVQNRPILAFSVGGKMGTMSYEEKWNPPNSYSQAMQLLAKLKLEISWEYDRVLVRSDRHTIHYELLNGDNKAALCRAITRAGASIGEKMGRAE